MSEEKNKVSLKINGKIFTGWLSVSIMTTLQSLARVFHVTISKDSKERTSFFFISPCDSVEVFIGKDKVLTGFISKITSRYTDSSVSISIEGVSKTGHLEDCTLPISCPRSYKNLSPQEGLADICKPFGIAVVDKVGRNEKFDFDIKVDESVGSFISSFLKKKSLLVTDDEAGNLVITSVQNASKAHDTLSLGKNILKAQREIDGRKLYRWYSTFGQSTNPKSNKTSFDISNIASSEDNVFPLQFRHIAKQVSGNASQKTLMKAAEVYRDAAIGNSDVLTYSVQGWRQSNDELWKVNSVVTIKDSFLETDNDWIVTKVTYKLDGSGTTTDLELKSSLAFSSLSEDESKTLKNVSYPNLKKNSGKTTSAKWTTK